MAHALSALWSHQRRWLRWQAWTAAASSIVTASVPPGDSFSPLAMLALLVAPTAAVSAECPLVRHTLFVDDRALTSPDTDALTQAVSLWERWSSALGPRLG